MDKTLIKNPDPRMQQRETYRYWASRPFGERLAAVAEISQAAYSFRGAHIAEQGSNRTLVRFERAWR